MSVKGIGVDIQKVTELYEPFLDAADPFIKRVFTDNEVKVANLRPRPALYYATRFAGKEAVFKALNLSSEHTKLNEIEIVSDQNGRPEVVLYGDVKDETMKKGIEKVFISLSYDQDYAIAYALAV